METSKDPTPLSPFSAESYASLERGPIAQPPSNIIDPNNPPWGLLAAILTWLGSVVLLLVMNLLVIVPYNLYKFKGGSREALENFLTTDKTAILLLILSAIPAHLLTLGIAWAVITHFGKRPFWSALGWTWSKRVGFWTSTGLAVGLYIVGISMVMLFGEQKTSIDQVVASSRAAALSLAFMAVFTAPLVEEVIYRGILYPALQRAVGMHWAIVGVLVLFTLIHVPQYWPNFGVIGAVGLLSLSLTLVRAYTGRLLPCFVMHLVFNGIQSILIILQPYLPPTLTGEGQAGAFVMLFSQVVLMLN
ncbi:MAG TPA: CPBP family intramembrane glutamic endopeptidase [Pyrinomonadaceae bacterium]|nr:CPBP family intramembrane glutamic endopeptidase [Pyrinomonadaceae bacterium]